MAPVPSRAVTPSPAAVAEALPDQRREQPRPPQALFALAALAVGVGGAIVLFANLPVGTLGVDEPLYISVGWDYVNGEASRNLEHPYLAKQLIGLSQSVFGRTLLGARLAGSVLAGLTALVVFEVGRRVAGRWTGLLAAALFLLLPQAPGTNVVRLDRVAALDTAMSAFLALSLLLAVVAVQRRSAVALVAAAAAAGLAASAKLPGAVAVVPVALAVLALRAEARRTVWLAATVLAAPLAFWLPYAAQGDARLAGLRYAFAFQAQHAADGHPQLVAGTVHVHAPWWSHWWWQQDYLGVPATLVLWTAALVAVVSLARRTAPADPSASVLVLALLAASIAVVLVSPLRLPHYHLVWSVALAVVAASGLAATTARHRLVAGLLAAPLALSAAVNVERAATLEASDYGRLPRVLAQAGVDRGPVLVWGSSAIAQHYLPPSLPLTDDPARAVAIVIDPVVADRLQGTPTDRMLDDAVQSCGPVQHVDRLLLYPCPP